MEEPSPVAFMEELRAVRDAPKAQRLSARHLELRDHALLQIHRAMQACESLEALERGETGEPIRSPRHHDVEVITTALRSLHDQLDRVYV